MDWYALVVFIHAAAILLFFIAHGTSMAVAFAVKREEDPQRLRALLDLSRAAIGPAVSALSVIGLLGGILAGFMGNWWGQLWIWISLVLLLVVAFAMTPLMAARLNAIEPPRDRGNPRQKDAPPLVENLRGAASPPSGLESDADRRRRHRLVPVDPLPDDREALLGRVRARR